MTIQRKRLKRKVEKRRQNGRKRERIKMVKKLKEKSSETINSSKKVSYSGGGVLSGKGVRGCAAQIGCFFGLSGFAMAPYLFENWF